MTDPSRIADLVQRLLDAHDEFIALTQSHPRAEAEKRLRRWKEATASFIEANISSVEAARVALQTPCRAGLRVA